MKFSSFGDKFTSKAGITSLMEDLGNALAGDSGLIMMGGGNPAHIPEVQDYFKNRLLEIVESTSDFQQLIGVYDPPQGNLDFIKSLASLLKAEYGWDIGPQNIALTNGSQAAFFMLFNLFAGKYSDGSSKQVLLPLAPEYIGYSDAGLVEDFFISNRPKTEEINAETFKYHIDFEKFQITESTGAICVSRPTNPTGNVITNSEMSKLDQLAREHKVPLIVDGAYGTPFPNLIFTDAEPTWNQNIVLCLSLSKFGLPAARTGIVIADAPVISALSEVNAIMNLATGSFGSIMAKDLVDSKRILTLSNEVIRPYYLSKAERARDLLCQLLQGLPFLIHKVEGAMFIWLWLKDCPLSNQELYEKLKDKGVLIVSGHHFFPGLSDDNWKHKSECLRITYSQDDVLVDKGLRIIADEIKRAYSV